MPRKLLAGAAAFAVFSPCTTSAITLHAGRSADVPPEDNDEFLAAVAEGPATEQDKIKEQIDKAKADRYKDVERFATMLPFRPRGLPYENFKERCMGFVQGIMKRSSYNPERLKLVMPPCQWKDKQMCEVLYGELESAMKEMDMPSHTIPVAPPKVPDSAVAIATGEKFKKGSEPPRVPEGVDDDVAGVYAACRKDGGTEDACKEEAQKAKKEVEATSAAGKSLFFDELSRAAESQAAGRLDEPVQKTSVFKWCDQVYNAMKARHTKETVDKLVDERDPHFDHGVENPEENQDGTA